MLFFVLTCGFLQGMEVIKIAVSNTNFSTMPHIYGAACLNRHFEKKVIEGIEFQSADDKGRVYIHCYPAAINASLPKGDQTLFSNCSTDDDYLLHIEAALKVHRDWLSVFWQAKRADEEKEKLKLRINTLNNKVKFDESTISTLQNESKQKVDVIKAERDSLKLKNKCLAGGVFILLLWTIIQSPREYKDFFKGLGVCFLTVCIG